MLHIDIKPLLYHHLQPFAQAANCQLLIADNKSFKSYESKLEMKADVLGFDKDQVEELYDAIKEHGFIAILKSKTYLGTPEIASFFAKVGLDDNSIHHLRSRHAKDYDVWGDLDDNIPENNRMFFYWFAIDVDDYS